MLWPRIFREETELIIRQVPGFLEAQGNLGKGAVRRSKLLFRYLSRLLWAYLGPRIGKKVCAFAP